MSSRLTGATPPTLGLPPEAQRRLEPSSLPPRQPENVLPTISGLSLPPLGLGGRGGRGGTPPGVSTPSPLPPLHRKFRLSPGSPSVGILGHSATSAFSSHVKFPSPLQLTFQSHILRTPSFSSPLYTSLFLTFLWF